MIKQLMRKEMASTFSHGQKSLFIVAFQILGSGPPTVVATCPPASELVYSPFRPYSQSEYFTYNQATDNACWWWAICLLSSADEARKQQFAATSLVMGLVPLTLKDIAWPERRVVLVSRHLPKKIEVIIRALGLVPSINTASYAEKQAVSSTSLYQRVQRLSRNRSMLLVAICALGLALTYAALAVMEVYSKRSSLGCPYPIFILTWHLLAIIPAGIETAFRRTPKEDFVPEAQSQPTAAAATFSGRPDDRKQQEQPVTAAVGEPSCSPDTAQSAKSEIRDRFAAGTKRIDSAPAVQPKPSIPLEDTSPVQGRGKLWLVQLVWGVYYVAGTLVYTSIMAVTVIELFVWVMTSVAVTAASKFLGFFLCMAVEKRWEFEQTHRG
ncbi:hypothetical protein MMC22_003044 [Lobaria immixta]|nr:hypothetical protein [Lobaria immixta]